MWYIIYFIYFPNSCLFPFQLGFMAVATLHAEPCGVWHKIGAMSDNYLKFSAQYNIKYCIVIIITWYEFAIFNNKYFQV